MPGIVATQARLRALHHRVADAEHVRGRRCGWVVVVVGFGCCPWSVRVWSSARDRVVGVVGRSACSALGSILRAVVGAVVVDARDARSPAPARSRARSPSISATSVERAADDRAAAHEPLAAFADGVAHDLAVAADRALADRRLDETERQLGRARTRARAGSTNTGQPAYLIDRNQMPSRWMSRPGRVTQKIG